MPPALLQYIPLAALGISVLALCVSFANLGWNMYRELALRGRLKVSFGVREIIHETFPEPLTRTFISATNLGPGPVHVTMITCKEAPLWRRILRRVKRSVIIYDYTERLSARLPSKLEVGDSINLVLRYFPEFKLDASTTHIGLLDSFGREHWAPCSDVREFHSQYDKDSRKTAAS